MRLYSAIDAIGGTKSLFLVEGDRMAVSIDEGKGDLWRNKEWMLAMAFGEWKDEELDWSRMQDRELVWDAAAGGMSDYPINSTARVYYDCERNPCTLAQMVRNEPRWAESRIREGEKAIAERDALAARVEQVERLFKRGFDSGSDHDLDAWETEAKEVLAEPPTTSLARLKAEWQAEGAVLVGALLVDKYESNFPGGEDEILQICDYALRRQAEEG